MSDGSLKTADNQTFWIFNLTKTIGEICKQSISCQNSRNVTFRGNIVEMKEEPPIATSVTEMVIQHCVNKACFKDWHQKFHFLGEGKTEWCRGRQKKMS